MPKKYHIHTFGCQMNVHDSEKIAGILSETGYNEAEGTTDADVIVFNTCSIREKAEQKFFSELGRLKKVKQHNPDLRVAVAGCIAQQRGKELFKRFPYVDFVFGPDNIDSVQEWINTSNDDSRLTNSDQRTAAVAENPEYPNMILPMKREGRVRAWVSIMYGCDNFCAYCVVPFTRGRERSRPADEIYKEVQSLAEHGFKEITLLGQNVNSYGKNLSKSIDFPDLLYNLHEINGIQRIRFVTSHPRDFSVKLATSIRDLPKICEHVHLPVQSGSDRILSLMNRGYTYNEYKGKIDALRNVVPDIAITTDIIVGFPGETDDDFDLTVKAITDIEYDGIFSFKYSKRPDTKALGIPDHVDKEIKSRRLSRVLELQESITHKKNKALEGEVLEVLVEGPSETDPDKLTGRSSTNKIVNFHGKTSDIGNLIDIKIIEAKLHSLFGEKV